MSSDCHTDQVYKNHSAKSYGIEQPATSSRAHNVREQQSSSPDGKCECVSRTCVQFADQFALRLPGALANKAAVAGDASAASISLHSSLARPRRGAPMVEPGDTSSPGDF